MKKLFLRAEFGPLWEPWEEDEIGRNEVLGCFGQSGLQRKKLSTAITMQLTFWCGFLMFSRAKINYKNIP
jgi:hypothetical protein